MLVSRQRLNNPLSDLQNHVYSDISDNIFVVRYTCRYRPTCLCCINYLNLNLIVLYHEDRNPNVSSARRFRELSVNFDDDVTIHHRHRLTSHSFVMTRLSVVVESCYFME